MCKSAPNADKTTKAGKVTVEDEVILRRIASTKVIDDNDPISMMDNVKVEAIVTDIVKHKKTRLSRDTSIRRSSRLPLAGPGCASEEKDQRYRWQACSMPWINHISSYILWANDQCAGVSYIQLEQ